MLKEQPSSSSSSSSSSSLGCRLGGYIFVDPDGHCDSLEEAISISILRGYKSLHVVYSYTHDIDEGENECIPIPTINLNKLGLKMYKWFTGYISDTYLKCGGTYVIDTVKRCIQHYSEEVKRILTIRGEVDGCLVVLRNGVDVSLENLAMLVRSIGDKRVGIALDIRNFYVSGEYDFSRDSGVERLFSDLHRLSMISSCRVIYLNDSDGRYKSMKEQSKNMVKIGSGEIWNGLHYKCVRRSLSKLVSISIENRIDIVTESISSIETLKMWGIV